MTENPPQQPAKSLSATRSAFISITLRWWLLFVATVACVPLIWFMLNAPEPSSQVGRTTKQFVVTAAFLMLICFGPMAPVGVWIAERRRRALREPWIRWRVQYQRANYEHVTLIDEQGRKVQTHMLNTWPARRGRLFDESTTHVWFAGDPLRRGVLSRTGGADLRYCWASTPTAVEIRATLARSASSTEHGLQANGSSTVAANSFTAKRADGHTVMAPPPDLPVPETPPNFGGLEDSRFPSPRRLRRWLAYLADITIHLGLAVGIAFIVDAATSTVTDLDRPDVDPRVVFAAFLFMSFIDRVVLQSFSHTTIGKLFFDLVIIDRDTGRYPRFRWLLGVWVYGLFAWTLVTLECTERPQRYFLPAVRRGDMEAAIANHPRQSGPAAPTPMDPATDFDRPLSADKRHGIVHDGIIDNNGR
ncbi:hypothetical protein ACFYO7_07880 [Nocardia salmonicida]|uniref:hypothetical protein n=1 Tax=Nocardia salmonicida TaxID=53431 RepID=UPI0036A5058F